MITYCKMIHYFSESYKLKAYKIYFKSCFFCAMIFCIRPPTHKMISHSNSENFTFRYKFYARSPFQCQLFAQHEVKKQIHICNDGGNSYSTSCILPARKIIKNNQEYNIRRNNQTLMRLFQIILKEIVWEFVSNIKFSY